MISRRSRLGCCAILAALLAAAPAHADDLVADLERDTPISAYGGALAWSGYDAATQRYALMIRRGEVTAPARAATARRPFDVSLGPDQRGRVVALYTRCRTATRGCDVYRYDLRTRRERKLASVSSPSQDEAWPAQWRGRVTFARRARTHVVDGFDHRPDPRRRGPLLSCDIPYVKTLSSRAPSRRLDRSRCGATVGMAIRLDRIIHVTDVNQGGAGSESHVRLLRAGGGAARILLRAAGGEGGYSPFVSPSLSRTAVFLTRTGQRQRVPQGFLRFDLASRELTTITPNLNLAGGIARDERGGFWYVQGPEPNFDFHNDPPFCRSPLEPCRLVRASASPFSSTPRTLLPRVNVLGGRTFAAFAADPPVLAGDVASRVVRRSDVVGRVPVPGVALALLRSPFEEPPGPFTATGATSTTDEHGRWSFMLASPAPDLALAVHAPAPRIASIVVRVTSSARITLDASGRALTGTVAPAQPGRAVEIQRLLADERGRLPDGRQVCRVPRSAGSCDDAAWGSVAQAPLDAAGSSFAVTVVAAGVYRARLSFDVDDRGRALAYGGLSRELSVAG
ncbi:MAG TPA: hypothetical protein VGO80_02130 [Solirubrobacteraceae bacterium]|jgi:hypothetical protein|nr:hypothetical protein [Solirubrobacteraceae bacterium]